MGFSSLPGLYMAVLFLYGITNTSGLQLDVALGVWLAGWSIGPQTE